MNNTITEKADPPSRKEWLEKHPKPANLPGNEVTLHGTCETYGFREQKYTPEIREWVRNFNERRARELEEARRVVEREIWLKQLCPEHLVGEQG